MKISVLSPSISRKAGGIFEAECRLSQSLNALDEIEIEVFGLEDAETASDRERWSPLKPTAFSVVGPRSFGFAPRMVDGLVQSGSDLLHLHGIWMFTSIATRRWSKRTGNPYVVSLHGMLDPWALSNAHWKKRLAGILYENASLREAFCLHALNDSEYRSIREYGLTNPVCIIPNGVDLPSKEPSTPPPWKHTTPNTKKVLLFLGRLHPKKGLVELLRAWASHQPQDWHLAIIGWDDGDHETELRKMIKQTGVEEEVHLLGPRYGPEKESALFNADAFILPSHSEGLPMAVLEAWAYRCPVLMTPQCNLPSGFEHNAALRIMPEPSSIATGLSTLFHSTLEERERIGSNGRRLVQSKFTWDSIASRMKHVYDWILGDRSAPDFIYFE